MINRLSVVILLGIIWGCANRVQPTGGPKDEDPPVLLGSIPKDGQRNFTEQEISLLFDEYVNVTGLDQELIITPRIEGEFDFKIKKRTVIITFEEPFADSTTYTLNFREAIEDITEGTPAENLILAFSTGNILDTLEITGTVVDLMTQQPLDGITIGLYNVRDTLDIFTGPPYYFGKTDNEGTYTIRNLKSGEYKIYAYNDDNKNLTCESSREAFAFLSNTIVLDSTIIADTLGLQYLNLDTLELTRTRSTGQYFYVVTNKYLTDASLESSDDNLLQYTFSDDHKGLKIYNTFTIKDSLAIYATLKDSLSYIVKDTFYLNFPASTRKPDEFKVTIKDPVGSRSKKLISGNIVYTKPIGKFSIDSLFIKVDSLQQYPVTDKFKYQIDSLENILSYTINIPQAILDSLIKKRENKTPPKTKGPGKLKGIATYSFSIPKGAIISVEGDSSQALAKKIKFVEPSQYGNIKGSITTSFKSYKIQLLNKEYQVVKEHSNGEAYEFAEVDPGEYIVRILIDLDEDGEWEMADIRKNKPAEPLIIYKDETGASKTSVRANWDITLDLTF